MEIRCCDESEGILGALELGEELALEGQTVEQICAAIGVAERTYRLWRLAHARTCRATARRAQELESRVALLLQVIEEQARVIRSLSTRAPEGDPSHG